MRQGSISKIVNTFGSKWGLIRPEGERREIFFKGTSLAEPAAFALIEVGQHVNFDEMRDQANGWRAERVVLVGAGKEPLANA